MSPSCEQPWLCDEQHHGAPRVAARPAAVAAAALGAGAAALAVALARVERPEAAHREVLLVLPGEVEGGVAGVDAGLGVLVDGRDPELLHDRLVAGEDVAVVRRLVKTTQKYPPAATGAKLGSKFHDRSREPAAKG